MKSIEIPSNDITTRYFNYNNKVLTRTRDDTTGNYLIFKQHLFNKEKQLKNIYGGNGALSNISASFLLKFPTAKYSDFKQNRSLKGQLLSTFKSFDSTGVLSTFEVNTCAPNEMELSIYVTISWETSDVDAEVKADALIEKVKSSSGLTSLFTTLPVPAPFDNVILDTSLEPLTIDMFVSSTIHSLVTTYNSGTDNTDIEIKTVGLYDHIGVKINAENDNQYRRLRINGVKSLNIAGVDPTEDVIIATLFDKDYKQLYTLIQAPASYIQQTQGTNGDLFNETIDGSITLDLNYNDFTTDNQTDFISTMNSETGGETVIINVYQGSAIVEYRIIFDVSKTEQEIDDVMTKLNDNVEIQKIIDKSATMNNVPVRKTGNIPTTRKRRLTKQAKVVDVKYDMLNLKIVFKTIGSYKNISYKATEQETYISTTNKTVDLPPGFTNKVYVKLVGLNDDDITTLKTWNFDKTPPVISLHGDAEITLISGNAYVEQGATVTDNSGESITPVISGTVDVNTVGTYTITYTATDSSGNQSQKNRTVTVTPPHYKVIKQTLDQTDVLYYNNHNGYYTSFEPQTFSLKSLLNDGDFTVEAWIRRSYVTSNNDVLFDLRYHGDNNTTYSDSNNSHGGATLRLASNKISLEGSETWVADKPIITNNVWTHVVWMRKNNVLYGFVNGAPSSGYNIVNITSAFGTNETMGITVGHARDFPPGSNSYTFKGDIAQVMIKDSAAYDETSTFTPSTTLVSNINQNTKLFFQNGMEHMEDKTLPYFGTITTGYYYYTTGPVISLAYNPTNIKWTKTGHGSDLSSTIEYVLMSNGVMTIQAEHNDIQWSLQPNALAVDYDTQFTCYFGFKAISPTNSHWFIIWFDPTLTDAAWPPMDGNFILPDSNTKYDPFGFTNHNNLTKTMLGFWRNDNISTYASGNIFGNDGISYTYSNSFNTALSNGDYIYFEFKRQSDGILHFTVYDNDASIILTVTSLSPYNFIYKESPFAMRSYGNALVFDKEIMFDRAGTMTINDYIG